MAAAPKDQIVCHVCGFKNNATDPRCVSCGAKLEELSGSYSAEEEARKRDQQKGFAVKWAVASFVIYCVLQALMLVLLPMAIDAYDPQGFSALMVSVGVWAFGGILVGFISPGKTFIEPAVGALFAVIPTIWWVATRTPSGPEDLGGGFDLPMAAYVIGGLLGGMVSLFGAFLGERLQDMTRGKKG